MITSLLYADDIVLIAPTPEKLQLLLDSVATWCAKWHLKLDVTKTKGLHFRKKHSSRPRSTFTFSFNDDIIEYAGKYKYLGFHLNEYLDLKKSVSKIISSANRALALLNH